MPARCIRAAQEPDGGFGLVSGASEADLTAMALQALAPYGRDETVERALAWLKDQMQPDGTYAKVRPAEGQPPVDSQMAMFGYFQNGFVQETDKPEKPKAESKPKAAAVKAAVKPVPRQRAALRPKRAGLLQSLFGRGKK